MSPRGGEDGTVMAEVDETVGIVITDWGRIDYRAAHARQQQAWSEVRSGGPGQIFLCEHPPVLTLGRLADPGHILASAAELARAGIEVLPVDRGGEVTLHAPGQLVVYLVLDLRRYRADLKWYLHKLEQVAIDFCRDFDILTTRFPGRTGVWLGEKKLVSVGIGVRQWVSFHGLAININTDLRLFELIRPCGLTVAMTSLSAILDRPVEIAAVRPQLTERLGRHFSPARRGPKESLMMTRPDSQPVDLILPELGEGITRATVACWHVQCGDRVAAEDDVVELVTDKATFCVPAGRAGTIRQQCVQPGDEVPVGGRLAEIIPQ